MHELHTYKWLLCEHRLTASLSLTPSLQYAEDAPPELSSDYGPVNYIPVPISTRTTPGVSEKKEGEASSIVATTEASTETSAESSTESSESATEASTSMSADGDTVAMGAKGELPDYHDVVAGGSQPRREVPTLSAR